MTAEHRAVSIRTVERSVSERFYLDPGATVIGVWPSHSGKFVVAILDQRGEQATPEADRTPIGEAAVTAEVKLGPSGPDSCQDCLAASQAHPDGYALCDAHAKEESEPYARITRHELERDHSSVTPVSVYTDGDQHELLCLTMLPFNDKKGDTVVLTETEVRDLLGIIDRWLRE